MVPRCMSTQHPDNVATPFFATSSLLSGGDEIQEAYYAFSHLGIEEQMWDFEGKEVDNFVVEKLLSRYDRFFGLHKLGRDLRITLRVPNPEVEKTQAKNLLETLESIPRNFDIARAFYGEDIAPIFEVILPMASSASSLNRIYHYYRRFVYGKAEKSTFKGDIKIKDWIGDFNPRNINVIPLIEDRESMLSSDAIVGEYLEGKSLEHQRVFLARSDPAMNYGSLSAVLLNKIALQRIWRLAEKHSLELLPIIGVGSSPFRGNFTPSNVDNCLQEYPSVQTFTLQSAFKYDNPESTVRRAVGDIGATSRKQPRFVEEEEALKVVDRTTREYERAVNLLAPLINQVARHVPQRRKRKLHIGLFGYSRQMGEVSLPRAIAFCCALYSIGLPPELLGLNALEEKDMERVEGMYVNWREDLEKSMGYFNPQVEEILPREVWKNLNLNIVDYEANLEHREITSRIISSLKEGQELEKDILEAAWIRKFLG